MELHNSHGFSCLMGMSGTSSTRWANDHAIIHPQPNISDGLEMERTVPVVEDYIACKSLVSDRNVCKCPMGNDHGVAYLRAKTASYNLRWCESALWLRSYNVCKRLGAWQECPAQTGQWPCFYTAMGQDGSIKLGWRELFQWLWSYRVQKYQVDGQT